MGRTRGERTAGGIPDRARRPGLQHGVDGGAAVSVAGGAIPPGTGRGCGAVCAERGGEPALVLSGVSTARGPEPSGSAVDDSIRAAEPGRKGPQSLCDGRLCGAPLDLWWRLRFVAGQDGSATGRPVAAALGFSQDELSGSRPASGISLLQSMAGGKACYGRDCGGPKPGPRSVAQPVVAGARGQGGVDAGSTPGAGDRDSPLRQGLKKSPSAHLQERGAAQG